MLLAIYIEALRPDGHYQPTLQLLPPHLLLQLAEDTQTSPVLTMILSHIDGNIDFWPFHFCVLISLLYRQHFWWKLVHTLPELINILQAGNHRASTRDDICMVSDDSFYQLSNRHIKGVVWNEKEGVWHIINREGAGGEVWRSRWRQLVKMSNQDKNLIVSIGKSIVEAAKLLRASDTTQR